MKKTYDVLVIGPVSLDHNIDYPVSYTHLTLPTKA